MRDRGPDVRAVYATVLVFFGRFIISISMMRRSGGNFGGRTYGRGTGRQVHGRGFGGHVRANNEYVGRRGHMHNDRAASKSSSPPAEVSIPRQKYGPKEQNERSVMDIEHHKMDEIYGDISTITVADLLFVGLTYVGFERGRQNVRHSENVERFKEHYGPPPTTLAPLLNDLKDKFPEVKVKNALMSMNWFKTYDTERVLSARWRYGDLMHIRNTVKDVARKVASMEKDVIVFGGFDEDEVYIFGVDTVHFITQEFRLDPSSKWYDFKSHSSGLKYEFAMAIGRPAIVWRRGPFPASESDINIYRGGKAEEKEDDWDHDALYFKMKELGEGKCGVGDSAYSSVQDQIITTEHGQSKELHEFLKRVKQREETLHTRFKSYNILENRFRHGKTTKEKMELHGICVAAITVMTQYDFDNGRPPFQIR